LFILKPGKTMPHRMSKMRISIFPDIFFNLKAKAFFYLRIRHCGITFFEVFILLIIF